MTNQKLFYLCIQKKNVAMDLLLDNMKTYNYLEAQQNLSAVLNRAVKEDVIIKRTDGIQFKLIYLKDTNPAGPLNIKGITTDITTQELIDIVREQRTLR